MNPERITIPSRIITFTTFKMRCVHMLPLAVSPQGLDRVEGVTTDGTQSIAPPNLSKDSDCRGLLMLLACVDSQPIQDLADCIMLQHHVLNELLLDGRWHNLSSSWRFGKCQVWPGPWHGILLAITIYGRIFILNTTLALSGQVEATQQMVLMMDLTINLLH